ncbi:hypothetical protein CPB84DRAFT_1745927 [Gymnopilus junonius]|uniref:Uncharacterized protein n=1 Tax=Gymnopilus junonius TaxID=109634 RepID=A0A9P5NT23_GYMJU|nr:hypothetical protein CPB84DRAFT_1745927 [Gymnopilus junonius]
MMSKTSIDVVGVACGCIFLGELFQSSVAVDEPVEIVLSLQNGNWMVNELRLLHGFLGSQMHLPSGVWSSQMWLWTVQRRQKIQQPTSRLVVGHGHLCDTASVSWTRGDWKESPKGRDRKDENRALPDAFKVMGNWNHSIRPNFTSSSEKINEIGDNQHYTRS